MSYLIELIMNKIIHKNKKDYWFIELDIKLLNQLTYLLMNKTNGKNTKPSRNPCGNLLSKSSNICLVILDKFKKISTNQTKTKTKKDKNFLAEIGSFLGLGRVKMFLKWTNDKQLLFYYICSILSPYYLSSWVGTDKIKVKSKFQDTVKRSLWKATKDCSSQFNCKIKNLAVFRLIKQFEFKTNS